MDRPLPFCYQPTPQVPGKAQGEASISLPGRLLELQHQFGAFRPRVSICLVLASSSLLSKCRTNVNIKENGVPDREEKSKVFFHPLGSSWTFISTFA